jgi:hypothetical protein
VKEREGLGGEDLAAADRAGEDRLQGAGAVFVGDDVPGGERCNDRRAEVGDLLEHDRTSEGPLRRSAVPIGLAYGPSPGVTFEIWIEIRNTSGTITAAAIPTQLRFCAASFRSSQR